MADTIELKDHIEYIEALLEAKISDVLGKLEMPIDFYLNDIVIDFMSAQEFGRTTKNYVLKNVKLIVDWKPCNYGA